MACGEFTLFDENYTPSVSSYVRPVHGSVTDYGAARSFGYGYTNTETGEYATAPVRVAASYGVTAPVLYTAVSAYTPVTHDESAFVAVAADPFVERAEATFVRDAQFSAALDFIAAERGSLAAANDTSSDLLAKILAERSSLSVLEQEVLDDAA